MNHEEDDKSSPDTPEIQTRKRSSNASLPPVQVNDVEDRRSYSNFMQRLFAELVPRNVQQEGDLITMGQLRWSSDRVQNLIESELNFHVRSPHLQRIGDSNTRLMLAYRACLHEKTFLLLGKQHLDTVKTLNTLSTRVERWSSPKTTRSPKLKDS